MKNINIAAIWSAIRYVVVALGAFVVGLGFATADDWANLLTQLDTLFAGAGALVAAALGVYSRIKLIIDAAKS